MIYNVCVTKTKSFRTVLCDILDIRNFSQQQWESTAQVAQQGCGCANPGSIQGQFGQDFEQPDLVKDVPSHGRRVGQLDV